MFGIPGLRTTEEGDILGWVKISPNTVQAATDIVLPRPALQRKSRAAGPLSRAGNRRGSAFHFVFQNRGAKYVAPPVHPATSASGRSEGDGKASEGDNSESRGTNIHEVGAADRGNGIWNQCCAWKSGPLA